MAERLKGKIAIITGAARGQGAETARIFAAEGARVAITDILSNEGSALAREIGPAAIYSDMDVGSEQGWNELVAHVTEHWGNPDILVNNAGILQVDDLISLSTSDFERVLRVNLIGAWLGIKTVAPRMINGGRGSIVNICSTAAMSGMNGLGAYSASKWALRGLTKTAAMELGPKGVRVNAIFPGAVNTPMIAETQTGEANAGPYRDQPIRRVGEPEEIAKASLFLASDDASYLCGAEIAVDGGMLVGSYRERLPGYTI